MYNKIISKCSNSRNDYPCANFFHNCCYQVITAIEGEQCTLDDVMTSEGRYLGDNQLNRNAKRFVMRFWTQHFVSD